MRKTKGIYIMSITVIVCIIAVIAVLMIKNLYLTNRSVRISYPFNNALFPNDFSAPTIIWKDKSAQTQSWKVTFSLKGNNQFLVKVVDKNYFRPSKQEWENMKKASKYENIEVVVQRNSPKETSYFSSKGKIKLKISNDSVGAPVLYRQIPLPFGYAEAHIDEACYSTYNVSNYQNPRHEVLDKFPVCGNCHSSTADGKTIALDFDAVTRDKGGYFVAKIDTQTIFEKNNYMSWSKLIGKSTFGLFSKISPSGRYIITTVKDRVISQKFEDMEKIAYSQLFVPVNGVLAIYDTQTKKLTELPGANDMAYVQTNAIWTPDEKNIIFARAKALPYPKGKKRYTSILDDEHIISQFIQEKFDMKFDLYTIPFNNGKGGQAKPIESASNNGKSNFFPAISHDGKWLVYCQANNYMMLRPESCLYIHSMDGGKSKKLRCNLPQMNSWHSWSPNGKWIVFVSKGLSFYSDLFLTHIDENGNSSVPILLEGGKRVGCATNYPEFLNVNENMKINMKYRYVNLPDIESAMNRGKLDTVRVLLKQYITQGFVGSPTEYREIASFKLRLGEIEEFKKYNDMADKLELTFNRGF
ncbi:MAG: hypothetical protein Q8928_02375 [Bacteroidota bacterium]|nr:hypothetical protein [Bacteroidota bacterium]